MSIFNDKALKGVADAVSKIMDEELKGNQHKIDANKNGKVDAHDFKLLRAKKGMKEEAEKMDKKDHDQDGKVESGKAEYLGSRIRAAKMAGKMKEEAELDEAFPTVADAKKRMDAGKTSTGTVTKTKTGLVHKRDYKDDDDDAEDTQKKPKGYGARQNMGKRGQTDGTKKTKSMKESVQSLNESMSEDDYHNSATNYPLHNITGNKGGTLHSHSLKYLHDAHAHHEYARDMEEPSEGGGKNGAAAKAVKHIEKHVSQKYGKEAATHLANSHAEGNFHKVLGAARKHMATMKEEKLSFTEMLHLYNESGVEVINKIAPQKVKFGDTEVGLIDANIVNGAVGITVAEEVDNETFTKEVEAQKEKNAGRGKKAEVAKASVQAVKQEEVEQIDEISKELAGKYLTAPQGKGANKYKTGEGTSSYPNADTMSKHGKSVTRAIQRAGTGMSKKPSYYKEEEQLDEVSKKTLGSYIKAASHDVAAKGAFTRHFADKSRAETAAQRPDLARITMKKADKMQDAGMKRRANMAKAVDRLTKEDVEQIDERTLTSGETAKKEDYVKGMKKSVSGFKARYGDKAKSVMYATATKMAKKD
jgi:hypothetical protein